MGGEKYLILSVAKGVALLVLVLLACRLTQGVALAVVALVAIGCAFGGKMGWTFAAFHPDILPLRGFAVNPVFKLLFWMTLHGMRPLAVLLYRHINRVARLKRGVR